MNIIKKTYLTEQRAYDALCHITSYFWQKNCYKGRKEQYLPDSCLYIYSLLINKDLCESQNVAIKFPRALSVYLCLSSREILIFLVRVSLFISTFVLSVLAFSMWSHHTSVKHIKESLESARSVHSPFLLHYRNVNVTKLNWLCLYYIVLKGWLLLPNAPRPFQDLLCPPPEFRYY